MGFAYEENCGFLGLGTKLVGISSSGIYTFEKGRWIKDPNPSLEAVGRYMSFKRDVDYITNWVNED